MNPFSVAAGICVAVVQPASGVVRADDIGLIAGLLPDPGPPLDMLLSTVAAAPPETRTLAFVALARALHARGYRWAGDFIPGGCVDACGAPAGAESRRRAQLATLLTNDRQVIDNTTAASSRDLTADERAPGTSRTGDRTARLRTAVADFNLAWAQSQLGEFLAAEPLQRRALTVLQGALPAGDARLSAVKLGLAQTALGLGRTAEASLLIGEVVDAERSAARAQSRLTADALMLRARIERARGDSTAAEATLRKAIDIGTADTATRASLNLTPAMIDAAAARIGADELRVAGIDPDGFARLKKAAADPRDNMLTRDEGKRRGMLALLLLDRGADADALAAAQGAVTLAPDDSGAMLALALAELRAGRVDAARLDDVGNMLDQIGWGPGSGNPEVIAGRLLLARLYGEARVSAAWVQVRQGATGAEERLRGGEAGDDIARASIAFRDVFRTKVQVAWTASEQPPPAWPEGQRRFSIFFDIDRYEITPSALPALERAAALFRKDGGKVIIAGNVDGMSGTRDYSLALSERLASAAKRRLEEMGVPPTAIVTIGFGKERPLVEPREGRIAERRNRRVDIAIEGPTATQ